MSEVGTGHGFQNRHGHQAATPPGALPLEQLRVGQEATLECVEGGHGLALRLAEMGLNIGARFKVLAKAGGGPFILCVRDTRLMIGRGMARRVWVKPLGGAP